MQQQESFVVDFSTIDYFVDDNIQFSLKLEVIALLNSWLVDRLDG